MEAAALSYFRTWTSHLAPSQRPSGFSPQPFSVTALTLPSQGLLVSPDSLVSSCLRTPFTQFLFVEGPAHPLSSQSTTVLEDWVPRHWTVTPLLALSSASSHLEASCTCVYSPTGLSRAPPRSRTASVGGLCRRRLESALGSPRSLCSSPSGLQVGAAEARSPAAFLPGRHTLLVTPGSAPQFSTLPRALLSGRHQAGVCARVNPVTDNCSAPPSLS